MREAGEPRVLTAAEFEQIRETLKDPKYLAALAEDAKHEGWVEVDNPVRREVRPRRGTEHLYTSSSSSAPEEDR